MRFVVPSLLIGYLLVPLSAHAQDAGAADPDAGVAEAEAVEEVEGEGEEAEGPTPEQLEEARQLFSDGVRYAGEGEFQRAVIAFQRALEIKDAPAIRYNLASALYETGDLPGAAEQARLVADDETAPPELQERAEVFAREIRGRTATLTIHLGGQADGAEVDGRRLEPAEMDRALILEPGAHTIVGLRRGEAMTHREIDIPAGGQAHIDVSVIPSPEETARANPPPEAEEPTEPPGTPLIKDWRLWAGVGAAVLAAAAVVVVILVVGGGTEDPVDGDFQPGVLEW